MAAVAVALSLITFGLAVLTSPVRETADGIVLVAPSYVPVLRAACSQKAAATGGVKGKIVKNSLGASFIEIEPARGVCQSPNSTLHVPRNQVKAVRWQDA